MEKKNELLIDISKIYAGNNPKVQAIIIDQVREIIRRNDVKVNQAINADIAYTIKDRDYENPCTIFRLSDKVVMEQGYLSQKFDEGIQPEDYKNL